MSIIKSYCVTNSSSPQNYPTTIYSGYDLPNNNTNITNAISLGYTLEGSTPYSSGPYNNATPSTDSLPNGVYINNPITDFTFSNISVINVNPGNKLNLIVCSQGGGGSGGARGYLADF